jgi:hypothetical protein
MFLHILGNERTNDRVLGCGVKHQYEFGQIKIIVNVLLGRIKNGMNFQKFGDERLDH